MGSGEKVIYSIFNSSCNTGIIFFDGKPHLWFAVILLRYCESLISAGELQKRRVKGQYGAIAMVITKFLHPKAKYQVVDICSGGAGP